MGVYVGTKEELERKRRRALVFGDLPTGGMPGQTARSTYLPGDPPTARPPGWEQDFRDLFTSPAPAYVQPNEPRMWPKDDPWRGMREVTPGADQWAGMRTAPQSLPGGERADRIAQPKPPGLLSRLTTPDDAMMGLAMGLLNAGRWSTTPINMSQALAEGMQGYQEGKVVKEARADRAETRAQKKRVLDMEQARMDAWKRILEGSDPNSSAALDGLPPGLRGVLAMMDPEEGAKLLAASALRPKKGEDTKTSLQPTYLTTPDGKTVLGQLRDDGTFVETQLPEGASPAPGITKIDMGDQWGFVDRAGNVVKTAPKDSYTPAFDAAAGGEAGKLAGTAKANLPKLVEKADYSINLIDGMLNHPGRETATGLSSVIDPRNYVAGTDATDFNVRRKQITGRVFLDAFDSLRGGGQITQTEGEKATDAMARLDTAQSDAAFFEALNELKILLEQGKQRAIQQAATAGGPQPPSPPQPPHAPGTPGQKPAKLRRYNPDTGEFE